MQSLGWYIRRVQLMSAGEAVWRARSALRDAGEIWAAKVLRRAGVLPAPGLEGGGRRLPVDWLTRRERPEEPQRRQLALGLGHAGVDRLLTRADEIVADRLSFFDLDAVDLGAPIDWNRDHKHGVSAPMAFAGRIDYRDFARVGDCKYVWEPNRHHQLVVLGRAYRASADVRYARAVVAQIDSWLRQNPFGRGMNWRSPLELAIRLINWVWALSLIRDCGLIEGEFRDRLLKSAHLHLWDVARKFSRGSSANNHLIGEAAGVFIASSYFRGFRHSRRWRAHSRRILLREAQAQTYPDGGNKEQALGYHLFVLQFLVLAGLVARWTRAEFPQAYWSCVERMFAFLGAMGEGGEALPMIGDADEGYVLDLGGRRGDWREWMAVGAALFGRADFKAWAGRYRETAWWLLGQDGREKWDAIDLPDAPARIASRAFPDSGYHLLQCGGAGRGDRISVVFDCGPLGYLSIAPHGHADALSFTLRAFGQDVLVDPGTYDYFTHPQWRSYFRSTRAHNTVEIDGCDQSEMLGPFMWGRKANARCTCWEPSDRGGKVAGEHDGYGCLKGPVTHRRTLELDGRARALAIRDDILARGRHDVRLCFHLAEGCRVRQAGRNCYDVDLGAGRVTIELDPRLDCQALCGSEDPIAGWVSRGYHRKEPATTLVGRCRTNRKASLVHRIRMGEPSGK